MAFSALKSVQPTKYMMKTTFLTAGSKGKIFPTSVLKLGNNSPRGRLGRALLKKPLAITNDFAPPSDTDTPEKRQKPPPSPLRLVGKPPPSPLSLVGSVGLAGVFIFVIWKSLMLSSNWDKAVKVYVFFCGLLTFVQLLLDTFIKFIKALDALNKYEKRRKIWNKEESQKQ